jgi:predicted RNase H-like HicB family nuclease
MKKKKMRKEFTLEYWLDEGWFVGRLKEVPGIFSQGHTLEELKGNILEAYTLMVEDEETDLPEDVRNKVKEIRVEV